MLYCLTIDIVNSQHKLKFKRRGNLNIATSSFARSYSLLCFATRATMVVDCASRSFRNLATSRFTSEPVYVFLLLSPMRGFVRSRLHLPRFVRRARWIDLSMARFSLVLRSRILLSLVILRVRVFASQLFA